MPVGLKEGAIISLASLAILMIVILVHLICYFRKRRRTAADHNEMHIPVIEPVQAKPSLDPSVSARPSFADRIRPVDESLRREEFSTHEENSTEAVPVPEVSEEIEDNEMSPQTTDTTPANETTLVNDTTSQEEAATQEPCVSSPAAPTAAAPTQQTISDTEKNPRLLAFEQLMKDLGGRIE